MLISDLFSCHTDLQVGLPDKGFELLQGNLYHDMYYYMSPGTLGSHNGGTDFNDIVHPAARCMVEGIFGIRPNIPLGIIEIAPQLPPEWDNATVTTPDFVIVANGFQQASGSGRASVSVLLPRLKCASCVLRIVIPLRAATLTGVLIDGRATSNYTVEAGWGQGLVHVLTAAPPLGSSVVAEIGYADGHGYARATKIAGVAGKEVYLSLGDPSIAIDSLDDPQGMI